MTTQVISPTVSSFRTAGRMAFASGITGIIAAGFMIPVVVALQRLSQQIPPGIRQSTISVGTAALSLTSLFLILIFPKFVSDGLYTFPQGDFGVWLIIVNLRLSGKLPCGLRWFGMIVGTGLMVVGLFSVGHPTGSNSASEKKLKTK